MKKRNVRGEFVKTNNGQRYKNVQFNGQRMGEHKRIMVIALGLENLPKEFIVHHLDKDPKNNDINNLAIMTMTAHNRIHSHRAWNKDIRAKTNKKWANTVEKIQRFRRITYMKRWKLAYELRLAGKTFIEIGRMLNITRETAARQYNHYKNNL